MLCAEINTKCAILQDMDFGRDGCENASRPPMRNPVCNASLAFADGQEARLVTSQDGRFVSCFFLFLLPTIVVICGVPVNLALLSKRR